MVAPPEPFLSILMLGVGLVFGSFLNVCIYRLPVGQSVIRPRSRCPRCETPIPWYRNIPLLSWVLLRGRCANCSASISWRYPFVEALSALTVVGLWFVYGPSVSFPIADDHQLLPDAVTLTGLMTRLAVAWFNPFLDGAFFWSNPLFPGVGQDRVWYACAGAALGSGLLWAFGAIYGKLRGVEAMGMGDVKMMAMVGAFVGPFGVLLTIFGASLVGAFVGLAMIPLKGRSLQDALPFGCFLAPAALIALFFGRVAAEAYLGVLVPLP